MRESHSCDEILTTAIFKGTPYRKNYEWPEKRSIVVRTLPGMELFDRHNGDHLLYMINFFCTSVGAFSIKEGQKIENLIGLLPCEVKSEISVFNWLRGQYLLYGIKALRQILVRSYHEMIKRVGQNSSSFKK